MRRARSRRLRGIAAVLAAIDSASAAPFVRAAIRTGSAHGSAVSGDDGRLGTRHRAIRSPIDLPFQRAGGAWGRNARGRPDAGDRNNHSAAFDGHGVNDPVANGRRKLRVSAEERRHVRRGTILPVAAADAAPEDVADGGIRIPDFMVIEARRRAADHAHAAVVTQPLANGLARQPCLIDVTIQKLIRRDERPGTQIDLARIYAS